MPNSILVLCLITAAGGFADIASGMLVGLGLLILMVVLYFLPALTGRHKRNAKSILVLNLLLGWTLIGWIVALVWAVSVDQDAKPAPQASTMTETIVQRENLAMKKCPAWAESILADAKKYRYCGELLG